MIVAIAPDARPRLPRGVRLRHDETRDAWTLLAPETIFEANKSAVEILKLCDGKKTFSEIVDELAAKFTIDRAKLETDVGAVLAQLRDKRLIDL